MGALPTYLTKGNASGDQWRGALCRELSYADGQEPDMFHVDEEDTKWYMTVEAKKICGACPIRMPCLEYALANKQLSGVWGGHTTQERKDLREAQRKTLRQKERSAA